MGPRTCPTCGRPFSIVKDDEDDDGELDELDDDDED